MQVTIESMAFGGAGIAKNEGKVFFVKGGLPGDTVEINIVKDKGSYAEAIISEVITPSPNRVNPACAVFDKCGGCQLQRLEYSSQVQEKENIVSDTLSRIGGYHKTEIEPIVPSGSPYSYRNRVVLSTWFYAGRWHLGYNQEKSNRKVAVKSCPIANEPINKAIFRLSEVLSSLSDPHYPLDKIYIASNADHAFITLVPRDIRKGDSLKTLLKHLQRYEETELVSVIGKHEITFGNIILNNTYFLSPSVFVQANPGINEAMIETVLEWVELSGTEMVLDLYSGIGNFSIPLARVSEKVVGVEINNNAIRLAKSAAEENGITNITFRNSRSHLIIDEMTANGDTFDLIVLDPPREGAKELIAGIAELHPAKIIYISCDPATLARDLKKFGELGYKLIKVRPFDMFPQTYHIETICLLVKS